MLKGCVDRMSYNVSIRGKGKELKYGIQQCDSDVLPMVHPLPMEQSFTVTLSSI